MSRHSVLLLPVILIGLLTMPTLSLSRAQAQGSTLEQLFAEAVRAEGLDYVNTRNSMIERKTEAVAFLKSKRSGSDWHARVLAEAMIGRIEDPELYTTYYDYYLIPAIGRSVMFRVVTFYSLDWVVNRQYNTLSAIRTAVISRSSRRRSVGTDAPFLVELALKGSVLKKPTVHYELPPEDTEAKYTISEVAEILNVHEKLARKWMVSEARHDHKGGPLLVKQSRLKYFVNAYLRPDPSSSAVDPHYREEARCWAMLMLGNCFGDDPVTIPLLVELLQSSESTRIRSYAALALSTTGKDEAINPLTQARNDPDKQVREAAERSLARLYRVMEIEAESKMEQEQR